jgi:hypothetical protein
VRSTIIPWVAAFVILALATVGGVALANATVLNAGSFVGSYLQAIARGDSASALALPGVDDDGADPALMTDAALAGLSELRQLSDEDLGDDLHRVTFAWDSPGGRGSTAFLVERVGTRFGLFPVWGFAESPVAHVALTVRNDAGFFVNELEADTALEAEEPVDYAVLVPGAYDFGHEGPLLTAEVSTVMVDEVGAQLDATVDVQANDRFVEEVQQEVDAYLDACAEQQVLFPTGCPFGRSVENRVVGEPEWSIVDDPVIRIEPGSEFGSWIVPETPGDARLRAEVQSLFDGSISTLDEVVDFEVDFVITVTGSTTVTIESRS